MIWVAVHGLYIYIVLFFLCTLLLSSLLDNDIRHSSGKLLVNLFLQVVKRTNTPLIPQQMASSTYHGFLGRGFKSNIHRNKLFHTFPMSNLKNTLPGIPGKCNRLDIDGSARISGRPAISPFQGGKVLVRLSLGKLLVNLLQVVKRTNTPLVP